MAPSTEAATIEIFLRVWGPAGAIILIQLAAIAVLFKGYVKCQNDRVKETKEYAAAMMGLSKELNTTLAGLTEAIHMLMDRK